MRGVAARLVETSDHVSAALSSHADVVAGRIGASSADALDRCAASRSRLVGDGRTMWSAALSGHADAVAAGRIRREKAPTRSN